MKNPDIFFASVFLPKMVVNQFPRFACKWWMAIGICHLAIAQGSSGPIIPRAGTSVARPDVSKVEVLKELSNSFEEIAQRSGQGVVQIFARTYTPRDAGNSSPLLTSENSTSSGVIVSPDGYILTNAHAIRGAHNIRVHMTVSLSGSVDGRQQPAEGLDRSVSAALVGVDVETDLAVIKVKKTNLPYLAFGDSDKLKQGQLVLALGNPLGLDDSVSLGVVSAIARQLKPDDPMVYIQTDAPINPGNSGGPLLDADGRVVGINTFILTESGGSEGIGFAIPSNIARQVYAQLKTQGHVHRARLGLIAQTINPLMADGLDLETEHGVIVSDVDPRGPAATAGVKSDDVITALDGKKIFTVRQLEVNVYPQQPGTKMTLHIRRGSEQLDLPIETEEESDELHNLADTIDPSENTIPQLGILALDITKPVLDAMPDLRRPQGVVVAVRSANTSYSGPALEVGDAIYEINRHVIANVAEARKMLDRLRPGDAVVLLIERDGHLTYVPLELN